MARIAQMRDVLLSPSVIAQSKQLSMDREKTQAQYRNDIAKYLAQGLRAGGDMYDRYQRSKVFETDPNKLSDMEEQLSDLQAELQRVNNEIDTIEKSSYAAPLSTPKSVEPNLEPEIAEEV